MLIKKYIIKISLLISIFSSSHSLEMQTIKKAKVPHSSTRIVGGTQVPESDNSWRYIVALLNGNFQFCAGSLIAPNWVLTAAHCVSGKTPSSFTIGTGSYNRTQLTSRTVSHIIINKNYDSNTMDNDIALIKLSDPVSNIIPISYAVPSTPTSAGVSLKTAGWGRQSSGGISSDDLLEVLVPIVDRDTCNAANAYNGEVTDNMLCAGYMAGGKDSCQGDSGGPLMADNKVIGIVSWGYGCAAENLPGVYTNVKNYANWIAKNIDGSITPPDYTPRITVYGGIVEGAGVHNFAFDIQVTELDNGTYDASNPLVITIPKNNALNISYDASLTTFKGQTVQNSDWSFDDSDSFEYTLTYTGTNFPSGGTSLFGVNGTITVGVGEVGKFFLEATIIGDTGGDSNINNNSDRDTIQKRLP